MNKLGGAEGAKPREATGGGPGREAGISAALPAHPHFPAILPLGCPADTSPLPALAQDFHRSFIPTLPEPQSSSRGREAGQAFLRPPHWAGDQGRLAQGQGSDSPTAFCPLLSLHLA